MTDVRTDTPATMEREQAPQGDFIWYELMSPDPEGRRHSTTPWSAGTSARPRPNSRAIA